MPSRWQRESTCSRCACLINGFGQSRVIGWSPFAGGQFTLYRLCDPCTDALRDWILSVSYQQLFPREQQP